MYPVLKSRRGLPLLTKVGTVVRGRVLPHPPEAADHDDLEMMIVHEFLTTATVLLHYSSSTINTYSVIESICPIRPSPPMAYRQGPETYSARGANHA